MNTYKKWCELQEDAEYFKKRTQNVLKKHKNVQKTYFLTKKRT